MKSPLLAFLCLPLLSVAGADEPAWFQGTWDKALATAKAGNQRILLYFWNDNDECARLYEETIKDKECVQKVAAYVCYSAPAEKDGKELVKQFHVGHLPTMLVIGPDGTPEDALVGFLPPKRFIEEIDRIERGEGTVGAFRKKAEAKPKDLAAQFELAAALRRVGDSKGYEEIVAKIRKKDPRGRTLVGARIYLSDLKHKVQHEGSKIDFGPVVAFLKRTSHKPVRWEGWRWIAWMQFNLQELDRARSSFQMAWKYLPRDGTVLEFAQKLAASYWGVRGKLKTADKKFLVTVAEAQASYSKRLQKAKPAKREQFFAGTFEQFHASKLDVLACCYYMAGKRKPAIATAEKCIALDPKNENYQKRLEQIKAGK